MEKSKAKKRGRPATGTDPLISTRVPPQIIAAIDDWATRTGSTRSEAIRRLVEIGLAAKAPSKAGSKPGRLLRARELAAEAIDKIGDPEAHPEERAQRRRRLTKGPEEFCEVRVDRAKK
jgi:hypothetical protein